MAFLTLSGSSESRLGVPLGTFGAVLGSLGPILGCSGVVWVLRRAYLVLFVVVLAALDACMLCALGRSRAALRAPKMLSKLFSN